MELRYPSGETQPATGDPDGVNTPFISFSGPLSGFTCGSASTIKASEHCTGPSRPTFCHRLPTSSCSGRFIVVLVLPPPGRTVPYDVRNTSPSGHRCLLSRVQIFGVGRSRLPATPLTSGNAANAGPRSCRPRLLPMGGPPRPTAGQPCGPDPHRHGRRCLAPAAAADIGKVLVRSAPGGLEGTCRWIG